MYQKGCWQACRTRCNKIGNSKSLELFKCRKTINRIFHSNWETCVFKFGRHKKEFTKRRAFR